MFAVLEVERLGQAHACVADQGAARLDDEAALAVAALIQPRQQLLAQRLGVGRGFIRIGNAQAAAHVQMADGDAGRFQGLDEFEHAIERIEIGGGFGDLRADVAVRADDAQPGQGGGALIGGQGLIVGDAEFVALQPGGDVGVGARVHVRIDAQADGGEEFVLLGDLADLLQLGQAFDVEAADAAFEGQQDFGAGFAHAGEDDFFRLGAGGQRAGQLAAGDDVKAAAGLRQQAEDGLRGVGLDGVADEGVAPGQAALPGGQGVLDGRLRINEQGRAQFLGQVLQGHAFE